MNSFWIRLRSGILLLLIAGLAFYCGGIVLFMMTCFISVVGLFELLHAAGLERTALAPAALTGAAALLVSVYLAKPEWMLFSLFLGMLLILGVYVLSFPAFRFEQITAAMFSLVYVPLMLSFIYRIRCLNGGVYLVWLVFLFSWGSDTCAYAFGMLFGRHKLTPVLSPKKSIEGAVGGVIGTAALGLVFALAFGNKLVLLQNPRMTLPLLGALGSIVSQIGDLAASGIKRNVKIKDYGNLIPGHGGILDRFDSVIFTAPIVYYLVLLLQK